MKKLLRKAVRAFATVIAALLALLAVPLIFGALVTSWLCGLVLEFLDEKEAAQS